MTQQQLNHNCTYLLKSIQDKFKILDGYYYIDYKTIESLCGKYADAVFIHLGKSDIATFMDEQKGLIIKSDGIDDALKCLEKQK